MVGRRSGVVEASAAWSVGPWLSVRAGAGWYWSVRIAVSSACAPCSKCSSAGGDFGNRVVCAGRAGQHLGQTIVAEALPVAGRVGHPVGVEDEDVAGPQLDAVGRPGAVFPGAD